MSVFKKPNCKAKATLHMIPLSMTRQEREKEEDMKISKGQEHKYHPVTVTQGRSYIARTRNCNS